MKTLLTIVVCLASSWAWGQTLLNTPTLVQGGELIAKYGDFVYINGAYVAGFDTVPKLARLDAQTGVLDTSWRPLPDEGINDLIVVNDRLIVAGRFSHIAGQARTSIAIFDAATGNLLPIAPTVSNSTFTYGVEALYAAGDTIYFAYDLHVNRFNLTTGAVDSWAADSAYNSTALRAMTIMGNHLYLGGDFYINPVPNTIHSLVRFDLATGALDTSWDPGVKHIGSNSSYSVTQLVTHNNMMFVGGSFDTIAGQARNGLAALDASGNLTSFNPDQQGGQIFSLKARGNSLWVGGNFYWLGGDNRWRVAELDINTGFAKPCWDPGTVSAFYVSDIELSNDTVYLGCNLPFGGNSSYRVYVGETEVPTPLYITGPDTVFAGDQTTFFTSPLTSVSHQAEWLYENDNGTTIGAFWGDSINVTWNQLGTRTVSLYHSFNYGCYSDTITKQVVVVAGPGSGTLRSSIEPNGLGYYEQGSELLMHYTFVPTRTTPTDIMIELSDATGDFTNSTIIGTKTVSSSTGYINGVICNVPHSNQYKARVIAAIGTYIYTTEYFSSDWNVGYLDSTAHWLTIDPQPDNGNVYCSPQSITYRPTFDVFIRDSSNTVYQWYKNGLLVSNSISYTDYNPEDLDSVYLVATPPSGCVSQSISNILAVTDTNVPAQILLSTTIVGSGPVCPGYRDTIGIASFSSGITQNPHLSFNEGYFERVLNDVEGNLGYNRNMPFRDIVYQWRRGDKFYLEFKSSASCDPSNLIGYSDTLAPTFYPPLEVSMQTTANDTICAGQLVTFTTNIVNGAAQPTYQWKVNGLLVQNGYDPTYSTTSLQDGDEVYVQAYGSPDCPNDSDTSNHMTFTVFSATPLTIYDTICQGDSYLGHNTTGVFVDTLTFSPGCIITRTLDLTVLAPLRTNVTDSICAGGNYLSYTQAGTYVDTFTSAQGCDSIRTLNLSIRSGSAANSVVNVTICDGDTFLGHTSTGTYIDTFAAASGCDSLRTLNLTVLPMGSSYNDTLTAYICVGDTFMSYSQTGVYVDTLLSTNACDTIRTIDLTVLAPISSFIVDTICDGDNYAGHSQTGTYIDTYTSALGCDSTRTLDLTVLLNPYNDSTGVMSYFPVGRRPVKIASGDLNGDGDIDIVTVNSYLPYSVSVLLSNGNGTFATSLDHPLTIRPDDLTIGNFNSDTLLDVAIVDRSNDSLSILFGNGNGTFSSWINYSVVETPSAIVTADFNGDGKADLATANYGSDDISVLFGSGTGTFSAAVTFTAASNPLHLITADFNNDGFADLALANAGSYGISVLLGTGTGTFATRVDHITWSSCSMITAGDFNNDGILDLAALEQFTNNMVVLIGTGSGTFASAIRYPIGENASVLTSLDFNNDGVTDIASVCYTSGSVVGGVYILRGNGNGTFANAIKYFNTGRPLDITKGDFNNDGILDLAMNSGSDDEVAVLFGYDSSPVDVRVCDSYTSPSGNQTWTSSGIYTDTLTNIRGCDSIVRIDLVVSPPSIYSYDTICYGYDMYGYTRSGLYVDTLPSITGCDTIRITDLTVLETPVANFFLPEDSFAIQVDDTMHIIASDLNGDGIEDIVTSSRSSNMASVALGTAAGTFTTPVQYNLGANSWGIVSSDINNDGAEDIISFNSDQSNVSVLLGTGTGSFGTVSLNTTYAGATDMDVNDLNGDGYKDLVFIHNDLGEYSIQLGDGTGAFAAPVNGYVYAPVKISTGDLNSDGHIDLVIGQGLGGIISVFLNNGSGSFPVANSLGYPYYPSKIDIEDLNTDGKLDLAVFSPINRSLSVLLGSGSGNFSAAQRYPVGSYSKDVVFGDFDKNGTPDIAMSDTANSSISVLLNSGNGTFTQSINYPVSSGSTVMVSGRFNNDNLSDIAFVGPSGSYGVNVLLGNDSSVIQEVVCHSYTSPSGNHTWTTSGIYLDALPAAGGGCDSIISIDLTVLGPSLTIDTTVCFGEVVLGYNATGQYIDTFAAVGCDSIRTLNLTVAPPSIVVDTMVCTGTSVFGYTATGQYFDTLTTSGCQSIRTLNLTVTSYLTATINTTVCFGDTIDGYSATGQYIDTFSTLTCDSIRTLNLTVDPWATATINTTVCFGDSVDGYGATGQYIDTFSTAGCDSVRTLNLTVLPNSSSTLTTTICDGDSYLGYSLTGVYLDTFAAANGCDSVRTVDLTVLPVSSDTISMDIYDGQSYAGYTVTGSYLDTFVAGNGCDSIRLLDLTVLPLDTVWPGDANADGIVDNTDLLNIGIAYNSSGPTRPLASLTWIGQACLPWSSSFISGVNYNHADCNGDGLVDADDSTAVLVNYNLTHAKQTPQARLTDPVLSLVPERSLIGSNDTSYLSIHLGDQAVPANNIYGLAFTIDYSSSLVDPASVYADFSTCWVGNEGFDLMSLQKHVAAGQIDLAIVRNDHQNQSGFGEIGVLHFTTVPLNGGIQDTFSADFQLTGLVAVDSVGNTIPLNINNATLAVTNTVSGISELVDEQVQVYPNPTDREVQIVSSRPIEQIKVYSVTGQLVLNTKVDKLRTTSVDLSMLNNGLYMVNVFDGENWHLTKVVMAK